MTRMNESWNWRYSCLIAMLLGATIAYWVFGDTGQDVFYAVFIGTMCAFGRNNKSPDRMDIRDLRIMGLAVPMVYLALLDIYMISIMAATIMGLFVYTIAARLDGATNV